MAAKIHLLRPESITPIAQYLERTRGGTTAPVELACLLLYREREFRSMYASSWRPDRLPTAGDDFPFAPHGLTDDAAAAIGAAVKSIWGVGDAPMLVQIEDLFGLKAGALHLLRHALRPQKAHAFGYLVASRLASDLGRFEDAIALARAAKHAQSDAVTALALEREAAILAPGDSPFDGQAIAAGAERAARALLIKQKKWRHDWARRAIERFEEQIRRRAITVRTATEGKRFTKYLSTDADFCDRERRDALKGFDRGVVPAELRPLIPAARKFGVGDDVCRGLFVRKSSRAERTGVVKSVDALTARIDGWLKQLGEPPYGREAAAFF